MGLNFLVVRTMSSHSWGSKFPSFSLIAILLYTSVLLTSSCANANLVLSDGQILNTFDINWGLRPRRLFSVTGPLVNYDSFFEGPNCTMASPSSDLFPNSTVHVHLPTVILAGCLDIATIVKAFTKQYYNNTVFAALIVTLGVSDESAGNALTTPWGDPNDLVTAPFELSLGPESTGIALQKMTFNQTILQRVQLTSDPGIWNDHYWGTATTVYYSFWTVAYVAIVAVISYLHYIQYSKTKKCQLLLASWILICVQFFAGLQLLYYWTPAYPSTARLFFYWFSYFMGFIAFCLVLLTWVRVVSLDRASSAALSTRTVKVMHSFNGIAIAVFFTTMMAGYLGGTFPQNKLLVSVQFVMFCFLPVIFISQAGLFLFYGIRLISILKGFGTSERRSLLRRMSFLMIFSVTSFFVCASMIIVVLLASSTIVGSWTSRVLCDASTFVLSATLVYTLHVSRSPKLQKGSSTGAKNSTGRIPSTNSASFHQISGSKLAHDNEISVETGNDTSLESTTTDS